MSVKRKLKNTYTNFLVCGFLRMQKPGKHPLSTESGATGMGKWAQAFGGTGLLEMNIGRSGISMQLGMGGIDVGGALYDLGKRSYDKSMLKAYEREHGKDKGEAAYSAYVYGDWTQEHTAARLASGKDELYFSGGKEYTAKTSSNGKGGRRIEITDSKDRRLNAIQLGHEAYRDGLVGSGQQQFMETARAVIGHTEMALRMQADQRYSERMGNIIAGSSILQKDIAAYKSGDMMTMLEHAAGNYDWSKDYWRLVVNKDGQTGWQEDGSLDFNIDITDPEVIKAFQGSPELMNRLLKSGVGKNGIVSIGHGEMNEDYARQIGAALNIQDPQGTLSIGVPGSMPRNRALESFIGGTRAFAKVSGIAENMRNGALSQNNIDELNGALLTVQKSGWLVKNAPDFVDDSRVLSQNGLSFPMALNAGDTHLRVTSFFGQQMLINDKKKTLRWRTHKQIDVAGKKNIPNELISTKDGLSFALNWDGDGFGLNYTVGENGQEYQRLSHMAPESVMSYLKLFGSKGVSLNNGSLFGIRQNMVLGISGNTGISDGIHLDYAQYDSRGNKIDPLKTMWNELYPSKLRKDDDYGFPLGTGEYDLSVWSRMEDKAEEWARKKYMEQFYKHYWDEALKIPNYGGAIR